MQNCDHAGISRIAQFLGEPDSLDTSDAPGRQQRQLAYLSWVHSVLVVWWRCWFDHEMDIAFHP